MKPAIYTTINGILHKRCTSSNGCGEIKAAEGNFHKFTRSGGIHYASTCKICYRAYQRNRNNSINAVEPYGDLVINVPWIGTGRPVVTGLFGGA